MYRLASSIHTLQDLLWVAVQAFGRELVGFGYLLCVWVLGPAAGRWARDPVLWPRPQHRAAGTLLSSRRNAAQQAAAAAPQAAAASTASQQLNKAQQPVAVVVALVVASQQQQQQRQAGN